MSAFSEYHRDKIGWFFGLRGWQLAVLAVGVLPVAGAAAGGRWASAGAFAAGWLLLAAAICVPVRGRTAAGWVAAVVLFVVGGITGWSRWRSPAAAGRFPPNAAGQPELPGVLHPVTVYDGPPSGPTLARTAIIANHATRRWAVTAGVRHPGIGMTDGAGRDRYGHGLADLLDLCSRTELVDELLIIVRTVPDDGAERDLWLDRHRAPESPALARRVNADLRTALAAASVRTETFVTITVPEARLARPARDAGGGLNGRAAVLAGLTGELDAGLRGHLGATTVDWLTSPDLALACRTGFAPDDRAGIVAARHDKRADRRVNDEVPWPQAGPAAGHPSPRSYRHDRWESASVAIGLPAKGAVLGALAPVLTPDIPGERRSLLVAFPIVAAQAADRQTAGTEWAADLGDELRHRAQVRPRAKHRTETARARAVDTKLARGRTLTCPYAVATVTVPADQVVGDHARRLDAAVRRAGYAPLRLDLAHDTAFAASTIPLGTTLR